MRLAIFYNGLHSKQSLNVGTAYENSLFFLGKRLLCEIGNDYIVFSFLVELAAKYENTTNHRAMIVYCVSHCKI